MMCYCIENDIDQSKVKGVLVTNIELSDMARKKVVGNPPNGGRR